MTQASDPVQNRHEFVLFFDVTDGNPNGDPDAGNAPRIDPETGHGLVTDVCLKRKVRNFVQLSHVEGNGEAGAARPGYEIYVKERGILAREQMRAYKAIGKEEPDNRPATIKEARAWMCRTFFDVRAFGAVMSTGKASAGEPDASEQDRTGDGGETSRGGRGRSRGSAGKPDGPQKLWNCGQVRGPIQLSFARSIDPIVALEHAITRVALTNQGDTRRGEATGGDADQEATSGQIGRKSTVPYALYRAHGFVSPFLARDTGFTQADLDLFWQALTQMFEHDRSAARGVMSARKLIVFEHSSALGEHPAFRLFERVTCRRADKDTKRPARRFDDYAIEIDESPVAGVAIQHKIP